MNILFNSTDNLRTGWRFLIYLTVFIASWIAMALVLSNTIDFAVLPGGIITALAINAAGLLVSATVALLVAARFVDRVPIAAFGVGTHEGWSRDLIAGVGFAAAMLLVLLAGSMALGNVQMLWTAPAIAMSTWVTTVAVLAVSAANEELLFRGYPFQVLMKGIGAWPAIFVMSLIFGLLHSMNPDASALGILNTVVAGILLSLAYLKTRSLWLPYGIHVAWNVGLGPILGFPVSGIDLVSLWTTRVAGSATLHGGPYGPEGGLLGTLIFAGAAAAVSAIPKIGVSARIRALLKAQDSKLYAED